jgi:hypothetical protein
MVRTESRRESPRYVNRDVIHHGTEYRFLYSDQKSRRIVSKAKRDAKQRERRIMRQRCPSCGMIMRVTPSDEHTLDAFDSCPFCKTKDLYGRKQSVRVNQNGYEGRRRSYGHHGMAMPLQHDGIW